MAPKEVMNTVEAAAFLGISPHDLRRYARRGMIPARKLGKRWLFHKPHLVEWLRGETVKTDVPKGSDIR
ncbi:MAG: helix-turn-helix domain-containing protein [Deltaproteobacteria bacterium]|nr:helix-turn-helix domain-containing protein [Deltaproteobacteria bacterium]